MTENEEQDEKSTELPVRKAKTGAWWKSVAKNAVSAQESPASQEQAAKPEPVSPIAEEVLQEWAFS